MENQLLKNEIYYQELLKLFTHNHPDMMWIKDTEGKYIYANEAICNGLLMAEDIHEPIGKNDVFFAMREREKYADRPDWHTFGELCFNSDLVVLKELKPMRFVEFGNVKGEILYLEVHKAPFFGEDGNVLGTIGVGRDITEFQKQKNVLEEQAQIIENANDAFITTDSKGNILSWNPAAEKIFSYDENYIVGQNIDVLYKEDEKDLLKQSLSLLAFQNEMHSSVDLIDRNKTQIRVEQNISKLKTHNRVLFTFKDITLRQKLSSEIEKQEKIIYSQSHHVAVGQMIGNIAHQWRQPLSVITSSVSALMLKNEIGSLTNESLSETCDMINRTSQYLSNTITDFQKFIKGERVYESFFLNDTLKIVLSLQASVLKDYHINVIQDFSEDIKISGYSNELIQCFMNLINNSKDAFEIEKVYDKDRFIFINAHIEDNVAKIEFLDSAGGASDEVVKKIFDPYFTTKESFDGTGLGMNMTYNLIVEGMKGDIEVYNKEFTYNKKDLKGLAFNITLPLNIEQS